MALPGMEAPMLEWAGAVSGKFKDKLHGNELCRRQIHAPCKDGASHNLARNGFGRYFNDSRGLIPTEGKRMVPVAAGGEVLEWRPSRRSLSEPGSQHFEKSEGRRMVETPPRKVYSVREKRHVRQVESKEEHYDRPVGPRTVYRAGGLRAADQPAREVDISTEMARKKGTHDLLGQRNGIGCRTLGDKPYRNPEYEKGFHAGGSLVTGSSFVRGHFSKTQPRNGTTVHLELDAKEPGPSYEELSRKRQLRDLKKDVATLTLKWEAEALKECEDAHYEDLEGLDDTSDEEKGVALGSARSSAKSRG